MSDLVLKQQTFVILVSRLINYAYQDLGWKLTFGECYRTKEQAAWYAMKGLGIVNSLHRSRLAIDLNLWVDGNLSSSRDDYLKLGDHWKSLSTDGFECCWGGDFKRPDIFHFSISHNGVK